MKKTSLGILLLIFLNACSASNNKNSIPKPIPNVPLEKSETIFKNYMRETFFDPYSVQDFTITDWQLGEVQTGYLNDGWVPAYYSCVTYNAKNRMGAYTGLSRSIFVTLNGEYRNVEKDEYGSGLVKHTCW